MKINSIRLKNFQGYKDTKITFSPNFNAIVGRNNKGKSSIVRALQFVLYNTWSKDFIRTGFQETRIMIELSSGKKIIRVKGESVNIYTLKDKDDNKQRFENFGTTIPSAIQKALEMYPLKLDEKNEINMTVANQHDSIFLLKESPTIKAKVLGIMSGLHFIDFALRDLSKDRKNINTEVKIKQRDIQSAKEELKNYEDLEEKQEVLDDIKDTLAKLKIKEDKLETYETFLNGLKEINTVIDNINKNIERHDKIDFEKYDKIVEKYNKLDDLIDKRQILDGLNDEIGDAQDEIDSRNKNIKIATSKYIELLKASKVCPTCLSDITATQINKITKEM